MIGVMGPFPPLTVTGDKLEQSLDIHIVKLAPPPAPVLVPPPLPIVIVPPALFVRSERLPPDMLNMPDKFMLLATIDRVLPEPFSDPEKERLPGVSIHRLFAPILIMPAMSIFPVANSSIGCVDVIPLKSIVAPIGMEMSVKLKIDCDESNVTEAVG
jgi:hypothetical protein